MTEQEFGDSLDHIAAANPANMAAAADLCTEYRKIRPAVMGVISVLKVFAPKVAAAIETLIGLLDGLCGVS